MPIAAVLVVSPPADLTLPGALGRAAHAIFLDLIRSADPGWAATLHDEGSIKPFTAGVLEEGVLLGRPETRLPVGRPAHLRFTSLDDRLSRLIEDRVLPQLPDRLDLAGHPVRVDRVWLDARDHPWAGRISYPDLAARHLLDRSPRPPRLELTFASPTTFRSNGRHVPLPLPELVFGSALDRWNAFAPVRLDLTRADLAAALAISRYDLSTRLAAAGGGGKQVGFVGRCEYTLLPPDPALAGPICLLADYVLYSGIGHKTTMGLGRARRGSDGRVVPRRPGIDGPQGRRDTPGHPRG